MGSLLKCFLIYVPVILVPIIVLGWILCVASLFYCLKLFNYLRKHKQDRAKELSVIKIYGYQMQGNNGQEMFRYISGSVDDEDQNIFNLKIKIRKLFKFGLTMFMGGFVAVLILAFASSLNP